MNLRGDCGGGPRSFTHESNVEQKNNKFLESDTSGLKFVSRFSHRRPNQFTSKKLLLTDSTYFLEVSARAFNIFQNNNLKYVFDLISLTELEFLSFKNCGRKTMMEVKDILKKFGYRFAPYLIPKESKAEIRKHIFHFSDQ